MDWFKPITDLVEQNPIVISRFTHDDWETLAYSRRGVRKFTVASVPIHCSTELNYQQLGC